MFRGGGGGEGRRGTPVDKIRNLKKKSFSQIIITPLPRTWPDFRGGVPHGIFNSYSFFCLAGLAGGPQLKI